MKGSYISSSKVVEPSDYVISDEGTKAQKQLWICLSYRVYLFPANLTATQHETLGASARTISCDTLFASAAWESTSAFTSRRHCEAHALPVSQSNFQLPAGLCLTLQTTEAQTQQQRIDKVIHLL